MQFSRAPTDVFQLDVELLSHDMQCSAVGSSAKKFSKVIVPVHTLPVGGWQWQRPASSPALGMISLFIVGHSVCVESCLLVALLSTPAHIYRQTVPPLS